MEREAQTVSDSDDKREEAVVMSAPEEQTVTEEEKIENLKKFHEQKTQQSQRNRNQRSPPFKKEVFNNSRLNEMLNGGSRPSPIIQMPVKSLVYGALAVVGLGLIGGFLIYRQFFTTVFLPEDIMVGTFTEVPKTSSTCSGSLPGITAEELTLAQ